MNEIIEYIKELLKDFYVSDYSFISFNEINNSTNLITDLGFDELDIIEFLMKLESKYTISIDDSKYLNELVNCSIEQLALDVYELINGEKVQLKKENVYQIAYPKENIRNMLNLTEEFYNVSPNGFIILPNGEQTPIQANKKFFDIKIINQKYNVNDYVICDDNDNSKIVGVIVNFHHETNRYTIIEAYPRKIEFQINANKVISKTYQYFYIDSKGEIKSDFYGLNNKADEWRKICNNFFLSEKAAQNEKETLINKSKFSYGKGKND